MIKLVRLDERMIHGQVAIKWSRITGVDRIIVANDGAASNEIVKKSLMMAAPATCKTAIIPVEKAITMLADPKAAAHKILVIVATPEDLLKVVNNVKDIPVVNIGNYGRVAPKKGDTMRKSYGSHLYAYDDEVEVFKQVLAAGIRTVYQTTPEDPAQDLASVLGVK